MAWAINKREMSNEMARSFAIGFGTFERSRIFGVNEVVALMAV